MDIKTVIQKIITFVNEYLKLNGAVDEAIFMTTVVFLMAVGITLYYVSIHSDIPPDITSFLKFIWGGTVGIYVAKAVSNIWRD